jgi:hypothetical protein
MAILLKSGQRPGTASPLVGSNLTPGVVRVALTTPMRQVGKRVEHKFYEIIAQLFYSVNIENHLFVKET